MLDKSKSYGVTSLTSLYDAMDYIGIFDARLKTFGEFSLSFTFLKANQCGGDCITC